METVVYKFFGIPVLKITRSIDEEAVYKRMSDRFKAEMQAALQQVKRG